MRAILIAEKPSLMQTIRSAYNAHKAEIGIDIDFLSQAGHLVGLKLPKEVSVEKYGKWSLNEMPIEYPYEYKILTGKTDLVNKIKTAVRSGDYDFIIHAGDPDQEGELLVRLVLQHINNKLPVKRFWSNDLTEGAVVKALKNLRPDSDFDTVYDAALTRQHADYQFGMNVTGIATLKMGDLCKLGRVKAPIISIVVDRERAIRNFVEKTTYKPMFDYSGCEFVSDKVFDEKNKAIAFNPNTDTAIVSDYKQEKKNKKAPKLFKLSTLQTAAYKALHMSASDTLATLQLLYEAKVTSYPRTDCEYISSQVDIGEIAKDILRNGTVQIDTALLSKDPTDVLADKTYANDKAISTEGHTAVIPTGKPLSASASDKERKLYELICRQFLAIFATEKETLSTKVTAVPNGSAEPYIFTESKDINPGFEYILNPSYQAKTGTNVQFSKGMTLNPITFNVKECVSKPPARFNIGSLIEALDKPDTYDGEDGKIKFKIGTPATRANIIDECVNNGYLSVKSGSFYAEPKAEAVIDAFPDVPLFNPVESGRWEELFGFIKDGSLSAQDADRKFIEAMTDTAEKMKASNTQKLVTAHTGKGGAAGELGKCPKCGAPIISGKYGPYCSGKCGMSVGRYYSKVLSDTQVKSLLAGKKTLVKGMTSKSGKKQDVYITPGEVVSYSYTRKDGTQAGGYQWKFNTEYVK